MEQKIILGVVGLLVVAAVGIFMFAPPPTTSEPAVANGTYTALAQCIKDSGTTFFGAFWCPHCQAQKKAFGDAATLLPYVECSAPDGKSQLPVCKDAEVSSYPTWEFADKSRLTGEIPLATLAEKTGCTLPTGTEAVVEVSTEESASPAQ